MSYPIGYGNNGDLPTRLQFPGIDMFPRCVARSTTTRTTRSRMPLGKHYIFPRRHPSSTAYLAPRKKGSALNREQVYMATIALTYELFTNTGE